MAIILETGRGGGVIALGVARLGNRRPHLIVTDFSGRSKMHGSDDQQVLACELKPKPKLK